MLTKTVKIGGKDRPVKYNLNSIIEFDELTGLDIASGEIKVEELRRSKNLRQFLFVGLKHGALTEKQEVDFTADNVGEWVGLGGNEFNEFLNALQTQSASDKEGGDGGASEEGEAKK